MLLKEVYNFFNISDKIVSGNYTEEEYSVYIQSIIEPIAKAMSYEFTLKLLTSNQRKNGEKIVFSSINNQLGNISSKAKFLEAMAKTGTLTINESRELIGKPGVKDGDVLRVSLNYVNHELVDEYQIQNQDKVLTDAKDTEESKDGKDK
jgi:hypothetical protein